MTGFQTLRQTTRGCVADTSERLISLKANGHCQRQTEATVTKTCQAGNCVKSCNCVTTDFVFVIFEANAKINESCVKHNEKCNKFLFDSHASPP